jgi:hypothetical protein
MEYREVGDDLNLRVVSESGIAQGTNRGEDDSDDEHNRSQEPLEVLGLLHGRLNR